MKLHDNDESLGDLRESKHDKGTPAKFRTMLTQGSLKTAIVSPRQNYFNVPTPTPFRKMKAVKP